MLSCALYDIACLQYRSSCSDWVEHRLLNMHTQALSFDVVF